MKILRNTVFCIVKQNSAKILSSLSQNTIKYPTNPIASETSEATVYYTYDNTIYGFFGPWKSACRALPINWPRIFAKSGSGGRKREKKGRGETMTRSSIATHLRKKLSRVVRGTTFARSFFKAAAAPLRRIQKCMYMSGRRTDSEQIP